MSKTVWWELANL